MNKIMQFGGDCERRISITQTTGDLWCFEISTRFPQAQHPRWQRNLQIIGSRCDLWSVASLIHDAVGRTICK